MKTAALLLSAICLSVEGFSPLHDHHHARGASHITISQSSRLFAGGFGGGGASKKKAKDSKSDNKQIVKLKPKQQWDRYIDMKTETKIAVGIRMKEDDSEDWLRVGYVRSKDSAYTAIAVALQRALIAEHAKRLYPLQVSAKKTLEWAYLDAEKDEWLAVDKSVLDETTPPEGIEKMVAFEGTPDPATGFYCVYDGGKLKLGEETSFN